MNSTKNLSQHKLTLKSMFFIAGILTLSFIEQANGEQEPTTGKDLFENKCVRCHGKDGTKGFWGAKNLQVTQLNDLELFATISNGRGVMPSWKSKLTETEIKQVITYVKSLHH